jgi:adenylate kinase family enzyme
MHGNWCRMQLKKQFDMKKIHVFTGTQGSGKTTAANKLIKNNPTTKFHQVEGQMTKTEILNSLRWCDELIIESNSGISKESFEELAEENENIKVIYYEFPREKKGYDVSNLSKGDIQTIEKAGDFKNCIEQLDKAYNDAKNKEYELKAALEVAKEHTRKVELSFMNLICSKEDRYTINYILGYKMVSAMWTGKLNYSTEQSII